MITGRLASKCIADVFSRNLERNTRMEGEKNLSEENKKWMSWWEIDEIILFEGSSKLIFLI